MRFAFSDDQEALRTAARRVLQACSPSAAVRRAMDTERGWDPDLWRRIGTELGWTSLIVPERHGGSGLGWIELAAVLEETGRALLCAPLFSTVALGANALLAAGSEDQQRAHLPGIAAGETTATLAFGGRVAARAHGGDHLLDGEATALDGHTADVIVVEASGSDALFIVRGGAPGLARSPLSTLDRTRRVAALRFQGVRVPPHDVILGGADALPRILDLARVALAAEQVGGADRCLETSVEYARVRTQFGRPIGSFQAIKHRLADLLVDVECARSAAYWAAWTAAAGEPDLPVAAATAKAVCSDAYFHAAAETIQVHGGIGFTWEHDAHLHFKRARATEAFLGAPPLHRERVALQLGL
jgi:alkylation response protein AidB-like acyl-CoA dehydrogenase